MGKPFTDNTNWAKAIGADGRPKRGAAGLTIIDGLPTSDMDLQQYRKRVRRAETQSTQRRRREFQIRTLPQTL